MTETASQPAERRRRWQFSLRAILLLMVAVAALSALYRVAPQLDAFVLGAGPAVLCMRHGLQSWRRRCRVSRWMRAAIVPSLGIFYVVSVGPAILLANRDPFWETMLEPVYAPLIWLHDGTLFHDPLDWYASFWLQLT
ncbi:MAG TPA: hypothetical protein VG826_07235 [Pirellulales bacterium]|nr:hypothetical protein [Pirellulales bacterium]